MRTSENKYPRLFKRDIKDKFYINIKTGHSVNLGPFMELLAVDWTDRRSIEREFDAAIALCSKLMVSKTHQQYDELMPTYSDMISLLYKARAICGIGP